MQFLCRSLSIEYQLFSDDHFSESNSFMQSLLGSQKYIDRGGVSKSVTEETNFPVQERCPFFFRDVVIFSVNGRFYKSIKKKQHTN
jgi:hypothetical protein